MNNHYKQTMKAVLAELRLYGIEPELSWSNSGHRRIEWTDASGRRRFITVSSSPSRPSHLRARADVRRALRESGVDA